VIFVHRGSEPKILLDNKSLWLEKLREARSRKDRDSFKKIQSKYGSASVKKALEKSFNGKCAYCESVIGAVAAGHIEHYRPKSRYISLTFEWDNLLLSCPKCNSTTYKGNKFPKATDGGPILNPCTENPNDHIEFVYDAKLGLALAKGKTQRGETTINLFGLNSRPELIRARSQLIKKLLVLKVHEAQDPKAAELLAEACKSIEPYLAWVGLIK
jgi:uncharacterized protein (TIGR02646 family)